MRWRRGPYAGLWFVGPSGRRSRRFGGRSATARVVVGHRIVGRTARCHGFFFFFFFFLSFGRRTIARVRTVGQPGETRRSATSRRRLCGRFQGTSAADTGLCLSFKLHNEIVYEYLNNKYDISTSTREQNIFPTLLYSSRRRVRFILRQCFPTWGGEGRERITGDAQSSHRGVQLQFSRNHFYFT